LERLGYRVSAGLFTAEEVGAPHKRERLFALAHTADGSALTSLRELGVSETQRLSTRYPKLQSGAGETESSSLPRWPPRPKEIAEWERIAAAFKPSVRRVADGITDRVDRLRALGNAVVPLVAAHAFRVLNDNLTTHLSESG
jgi:DNA (cytosine-5)-methyltransferase 1